MRPEFPFDPVRRSLEMERLVMKEGRRLYHKFRAAPYYGGIATADAVGCSFLCAYCWNYGRNQKPGGHGHFYTADEVAENLLGIARNNSFRLFRVTGSEPLLGDESFLHLLRVLEFLFREQPRLHFILETNGLILGCRTDIVEKLRFENLSVRVAVKGIDQVSFERITGAKREFFLYPFLALKALEECGIRAWPSLMRDLFTGGEVQGLRRVLSDYGIKAELELEFLEGYPFVLENMKRRAVSLRYFGEA